MNDYFVYDNDNIAPAYLPGIVGYGQQGAPGNTGDPGSSVYYSSYDLSYDNDDKNQDVIKLIVNGKALSNNTHYDEAIVYKPNDMIIDVTGNFYKITYDMSYESFGTNNVILSDITTNISSFSISCITSFYANTKYGNIINNDLYDNNVTSYKFIHNDTNTEKIYGNYIQFSLMFKDGFDVNDYTYKFVLVLPNGKTLETYSETSSKIIFVDNKLLFGNFDLLTWKDTADIKLSDIINSSSDISDLSITVENNDISLFELLEQQQNPNTDDYETNKIISIITSYLIKNNCSGYVEMINKESGINYRINISDVFIDNVDKDSSLKEDSTHINHIVENTVNVKWKPNIYSYPIAKFLKNSDGTLFNPFISYCMFETDDKNNKLSETGLSEQFYFVDAGGFSHYLMNSVRSIDDIDYVNNPLIDTYNLRVGRNVSSSTSDNIFSMIDGTQIADRNRTYKLLLKNTKKVSLNILFTNYSNYGGLKYEIDQSGATGTVTYPNSLVYIGVPDSSLIIFDKKDPTNGYINYTSKFVPPGYNIDDDSVTIADAGMASVIIDLENYDLIDSSIHTIEIGVTLLDSFSLDKTNITNLELNQFKDNSKINKINSIHRPSSKNGKYYHFEHGKYSHDDDINLAFLKNYKNELGSGIPDIKIYVTSLEEGVPVPDVDSSTLETIIHKDKPNKE